MFEDSGRHPEWPKVAETVIEAPMSIQAGYTYGVFVSYAEADRAWVEGYLLDALKQAGVRYHSEAAFALGRPRLLEFERAVQQSQYTLLVLSRAYLVDGFERFVNVLAQHYGLETATWPIIPLILHPVRLPPHLAILIALDATDPTHWQAVVERLCAELQRPVPGPAPRPPCPYPGMVPFSETDSDRFFGRDAEVQELLERLHVHSFVTVIGPSGSGKSSLVFAGLVPALRKSALFGLGDWLVRTLRPGEEPLAALAAALGGDPADSARAVIEILATQPKARRLLLIVDQFEELFTLARSDVTPFQQALLRLAETPNCYLVLTVRADFYADLMAAPLWPEIRARRIEVLPLDKDALREAIVRPAEEAAEDERVYVEPALVERLVADAAGEPGVLPLIQETLVLLWERLQRRFLPLRAYAALGGVGRTGLQVAMARRADAALADLTLEQQTIARRIFVRLVQFGEGRADTRRQQSVAELRSANDEPLMFDQTLRHLTDKRLLTLSGEEGREDRKVDIAHEALIGGWPTLQNWLTERRGSEQIRRRLEAKAIEWVRLGRGSGGLLDEVELLEAERWLTSCDAAHLGRSEVLSILVQASRAAIEEAEREKEAACQRELALTQKTLAVRLAHQAEKVLGASGESLPRSVLLAVESLRHHPTPEGDEALRHGLALLPRLVARLAHEGHVTAITFSPDEKYLATASEDRIVRVWEATNGREVASLTDEDSARWQKKVVSYVKRMVYRVGALLAAPLLGRARNLFLPSFNSVTAITFSPDGKYLATVTGNTALVWEVASGREVARMIHDWPMNAVAFSLDGEYLVTVQTEEEPVEALIQYQTAQVWEMASGREVAYMRIPPPYREFSSYPWRAISPDGKYWAEAGRASLTHEVGLAVDYTARVWEGGQEITRMTYEGDVLAVTFSPDGKYLATASEDHTARVWEVASGQEVARMIHEKRVTAVAFSPDGKYLATVRGYPETLLGKIRRFIR